MRKETDLYLHHGHNAHTEVIPGGEIRGQVEAVPLPAAAWLLGPQLPPQPERVDQDGRGL